MKKKSLVHTHVIVPNYGANLQAVATNKLLKSCGYEQTYLAMIPMSVLDKYQGTVSASQFKLHSDFVSTELNITEMMTTPEEVEVYLKSNVFDLYVTGSDAVFKLSDAAAIDEWDLKFPNAYWLCGMAGKRIAISPSAMGSHIFRCVPAALRDDFRKNLEGFELLTVRDEWTKNQLALFGVESYVTLDPVFLLPRLDDKYDFRSSGHSRYVVSSIPAYFGSEWTARLAECLRLKGYDLIDIGTPERPSQDLDPYDWYSLIAKSAGFIGQRFHPLVVALANHKPVFALDQYARTPLHRRKSKTFLMLKQFGLQANYSSKLGYRILRPESVVKKLLGFRDVGSVVDRNSLDSYDYLIKSLGDIK